jgi:hypothetical protein
MKFLLNTSAVINVLEKHMAVAIDGPRRQYTKHIVEVKTKIKQFKTIDVEEVLEELKVRFANIFDPYKEVDKVFNFIREDLYSITTCTYCNGTGWVDHPTDPDLIVECECSDGKVMAETVKTMGQDANFLYMEEKEGLECELYTLETLLAQTLEERIIDRKSIENRIKVIEEKLIALQNTCNHDFENDGGKCKHCGMNIGQIMTPIKPVTFKYEKKLMDEFNSDDGFKRMIEIEEMKKYAKESIDKLTYLELVGITALIKDAFEKRQRNENN